MTPPPHPGSSEMKVSQPKKKKRKKGKKKKKSRPMALSSHVSGPKSPVLSFKETEKNRGKKISFFSFIFFFENKRDEQILVRRQRNTAPRIPEKQRNKWKKNERKTTKKNKQTNKRQTHILTHTPPLFIQKHNGQHGTLLLIVLFISRENLNTINNSIKSESIYVE